MGTYVDIPSSGLSTTGYTQAKDFVEHKFDIVNDYGNETYNATMRYMVTLESMLVDLEAPDTSPIDVDTPFIPDIPYDERPLLGDVNIPTDWPSNTTTPIDWSDLPTFSEVVIPSLGVSAPDWRDAPTPILDQITAPGDTPATNPIDIPTVPSIVLPSAPTLDDVLIPQAPSITIPEFESELPSITLDDPIRFTWGEPVYNSDMWGDLFAKVLSGIRDGGTGLDATVEAEIYQRLIDRQQDENDKLYQQAFNEFAARGFPLPPGALVGQLTEIGNANARNLAAASRDITINQAELAQKNTHFFLDKGVQLEGMLRDFFTTGTNRLFEASKITADNAIAIYNAQVSQVNLKLEAYKSEATVYESRVRATLTEIEIFKGQIEGAKVTADVQKGLVDVYTAQLAAVNTQMKLYVSEMEGAKIASEIEMMKLQQYELEVKAYIARLDAEKTKFQVYATEVDAEKAKAQAYMNKVQAFSYEVDAAKTEIDAQIKQQQLILNKNGQEVDRYRIDLDTYKVDVSAKATEVDAVVKGFTAEVSAYSAESQAMSSRFLALIQENQSKISLAGFEMQKAVAEINATIDGYTKVKDLQIQGTSGIMNVSAQLTSAAWNSVTASTGFNYSGSGSYSEGWSHGESISESHPFKEHE